MSRIGRYELRDPLGTGAMGHVYRAWDTVLEREVALKTIRTGMDAAPEIRQRFQREARACARLRHPHIITVYDLGEAEDLSYIAMELLQGADFRRLIQERRDIPLATKVEAAAQICEALAYAHREGLVHRDIKPSNLFLTDEGSAKILDFGIARMPASDLTMRGQILGTPKYMAPEQIQGKPTDGRADLFSVAVVLFEFVSGVHPFQGDMPPQRIVQDPPDSLLGKDPSLPPALDRVISRGLEKDPQQRYLNGDEMAGDLRAILEILPRTAAAASAPVQTPAPAPSEPPPRPAAPVECPPGQDPEEWRLSEALRLLPEFEAAVERRDFAAAKVALNDLEARLEGDIRFAEALRLCRSRMPFQVATAPEVKIAPPPEPPPSTPRPAPPERPDVDATMFGRSLLQQPPIAQAPTPAVMPPPIAVAPVKPAPPLKPPPPDPVPPTPPPPVIEPRPPGRPPQPPAVQPAPPQRPAAPATAASPAAPARKGKILLIGAVVLIGAVLAAGAFWYLQPAAVEPAVATAVVGSGGANIYSNPSPDESVLAAVPAGGQVNVLTLPSQPGQEWTRVQSVIPSVSRPGYIRTHSLRDWRAKTAAAALAAARLGPGDSGTVEEMAAQADRLSEAGKQFAADPSGRQALLESARLRIAIAHREKDAGQSSAEWAPYVRQAQDDLATLSSDPQLRDAASDLNQQATALLAPPPAPPSKKKH